MCSARIWIIYLQRRDEAKSLLDVVGNETTVKAVEFERLLAESRGERAFREESTAIADACYSVFDVG